MKKLCAGLSLSRSLRRDHGHLGWWCCWVGGWGSVNIRKRLAVSSLGTKIHAGEEAAASVLQERKKTRRLASAKSRRYFCLGALYSTSSGLCQRTHAHRRLISGQRGQLRQRHRSVPLTLAELLQGEGGDGEAPLQEVRPHLLVAPQLGAVDAVDQAAVSRRLHQREGQDIRRGVQVEAVQPRNTTCDPPSHSQPTQHCLAVLVLNEWENDDVQVVHRKCAVERHGWGRGVSVATSVRSSSLAVRDDERDVDVSLQQVLLGELVHGQSGSLQLPSAWTPGQHVGQSGVVAVPVCSRQVVHRYLDLPRLPAAQLAPQPSTQLGRFIVHGQDLRTAREKSQTQNTLQKQMKSKSSNVD
ncbi:hypothetical protein EYF80_024005 [Liparis tanakae]|uniref:Uncharacterized protein n=1 Tax=Liparis tanakae TaxID=230148 RepID=A0A4Z2HLP8_9TELE|nr:hypothetical protein EYF80_024005 [Liparis tanakae]